MTKEIDVTKHVLVPKHSILSERQVREIFEKENINIHKLPKIKKSDPAIRHLNPKVGDIIKIERISPTSKKSIFYRVVIR